MSSSFSQIIGIARGGMQSRMLDLDAISNNLANIRTNGYKASRLNFQEMLTEKALSGTQPISSQMSMLQGSIELTGQPLDMAIEGEGFFAVKLADGKTAYTRDGHFMKDGNGTIVTEDGLPLVWSGTLPDTFDEFKILTDGSVMVQNGSDWTEVGKISLTTFPNPNGLTSNGGNFWLESDVSGKAKTGEASTTGFGLIHGFSLETSNVNLSNEIAHIVRVQRAFQTSVAALQKTDTMISQAINLR